MRYVPLTGTKAGAGVNCENGYCMLQLDPAHLPFSHHGVQGDREAPNIAEMHISQPLTLQQVSCIRTLGFGSTTKALTKRM